MVKRIVHIIIGWGKSTGVLKTTTAEIKLSELRMKKCVTCSFSEVSDLLATLHGEMKIEKVLKCKKCGCPCVEKTLVVDEACPIDKW